MKWGLSVGLFAKPQELKNYIIVIFCKLAIIHNVHELDVYSRFNSTEQKGGDVIIIESKSKP